VGVGGDLTGAFALGAAAALAWLLAVAVPGGAASTTFVGVVVITVGFAGAAWGAHRDQPGVQAAGLLASAAGVAAFYGGDFWSGAANVAGLLFLIGCLVAGVSLWREKMTAARIGFGTGAAGCLLWVYADWGAWIWQPGNVLMAAALGLAMAKAGSE
jgi:hypothetical protein